MLKKKKKQFFVDNGIQSAESMNNFGKTRLNYIERMQIPKREFFLISNKQNREKYR